MVIFFKTGKKFISQQTRKESYICDVNMKMGGAQDVEGHKIGYFCGCHKCMTPKWFKITTNSIIRGSSSFFNIKPQARCILTAYRTTPQPPPKGWEGIKGRNLFFLFCQSKLMSRFFPVIPVSPDTKLKERCLG